MKNKCECKSKFHKGSIGEYYLYNVNPEDRDGRVAHIFLCKKCAKDYFSDSYSGIVTKKDYDKTKTNAYSYDDSNDGVCYL